MQYLQVSYKSYISLNAAARRCSICQVFLKISQDLLENTCAGVSFIIMLRAAASVPCQEYIKLLPMLQHFFHRIHFFSVFFPSVLIFPFKILYCIYIVVLISEAYLDRYQTSKMQFFAKIVNGLKPLYLQNNSILNIWQSSEYYFGWLDIIVGALLKNQ